MKKKTLSLVVALSILAVAIAVTVIVVILVPPSAVETNETLYAYKNDISQIQSIKVDLRKTTGGFTVNVIQKGGNSREFKVLSRADNLAYETEPFQWLCNMASAMLAKSVIAVDPSADERDKYGINEPTAIITTTYADGQKTELTIGAKSPLADTYYVYYRDTKTIYAVMSVNVDILTRPDAHYRVRTMTSYEDLSEVFTHVIMERGALPPVTAIHDTSLMQQTGGFSYFLIEPIMYQADEKNIKDYILSPLTNIVAQEIVEDNPDDWSKYGFDKAKPEKITILFNDGSSAKVLTLGDRFEENGESMVYVRMNNTPSVFVCLASDFEFMSFDHSILLSTLLWTPSIKLVDSVDLIMSTGTFKLNLPKDENEKIVADLDGTPVTEANAKKMYLLLITARVEATVPEGSDIGETAYRIIFNFADGTTLDGQFKRINERQFAAVLNDKDPIFYVNIRKMIDIEDAITILQEGKDLPTR